MEAQVEKTTTAKPQAIVEQLLDIAKNNDAMDVIGGSTSWRWQEGLITRMPKTKTVAAILTKAFNSEDPNVWLENIDGVLNRYVSSAFKVDILNLKNLSVDDLYEALILMCVSDGNGETFENLVFKLCVFKFADMYKDDDEHFINFDSDLAVKINREWATLKLSKTIKKYRVEKDLLGRYTIGANYHFSDENFLRYRNEISILRLKIVGNGSVVDMWKDFYISMSDEDMISTEKEIIEFYKNLIEKVRNRSQRNIAMNSQDLKLRYFSLSSITLPSMEGLK